MPEPCPLETRWALLEAIDALTEVRTEEQFLAAVDGPVLALLGHDGLVCGVMDSITDWNPHCLVLHRFPPEYMESIRKPGGGYSSEMIKRWQATRAPVLADPSLGPGRWWSDEWICNAQKAGLTNLIGHGFVDVKGEAASYFCFIRLKDKLGPVHAYLLNRLVPHLHLALVHSIGNSPDIGSPYASPVSPIKLSPRQLETLQWIRKGKTNAEVALILGTTEANVKYHLKVIFEKLDVYSRTLAVTRALSLGLIQ